MANKVVISITSKDKPGIIYTVVNTIKELGGNLLSMNQTVLDNYFSMIMIASFSNIYDISSIKNNISCKLKKHTQNNSEVVVLNCDDPTSNSNFNDPYSTSYNNLSDQYVLTLSSKTKNNNVLNILKICADYDINILNLFSKTKNNLYTMIFFIDTIGLQSMIEFRGELHQLEQVDPNLRIMLQHHEIFKATNEININI
ncbi:MAG TPA: ACT domain-containing protein [Victivallales bacterium]|nr:ACT domain-containing protein [Victivallales bacterium]